MHDIMQLYQLVLTWRRSNEDERLRHNIGSPSSFESVPLNVHAFRSSTALALVVLECCTEITWKMSEISDVMYFLLTRTTLLNIFAKALTNSN